MYMYVHGLAIHLKYMQGVFCDWRVDLTIEATLLYFAEVRDDSFCCCDDINSACAQNLTSLSDCALNENMCDTLATILLSGCECPGICCIQSHDVGNNVDLSFSVSSFPILETPATTVSDTSVASPSVIQIKNFNNFRNMLTLYTVIWEMFVVIIFSWRRRTTKIKRTNICVP